MQDEELIVHELALGGTRPALMPYVGIPWADFVIFLIIGLECIVAHKAQLLVFLVPAFLFSLSLYYRDYNAGRCFVAWLTFTGRQKLASLIGWLLGARFARYSFEISFISTRSHQTFRGIST